MLFNSYLFLFLFLPLALAGYYLLNHFGRFRSATLFLLGMSLWFYGYANPAYLALIAASIAVNFALSRALGAKPRKVLLAGGILLNLAPLLYFKYCNFFLENLNAVFGQSFTLRTIVLPLGISFFTFQQIAYLVDAYRGETRGYTWDEYALFVAFFPKLTQGPIALHGELIPQFREPARRKAAADCIARGLYVFALGLFKKVLLADTFGAAVNWGFEGISGLSSLEALLVAFFYTFQLYFDFSGYCDMAVGIGLMLHIDLPQNFDSPYKALSIPDFWARWHISLTRFLRTYIYFPLGGSRRGKLRTYCNILIVFLVSGIWHGANWTFILWGLLHGLLNCLTRIFQKQWEKLHVVTRWFATFMAVNLLWVMFRADSIADAFSFYRELFRWSSFTIDNELLYHFNLKEFVWLGQALPLLGQIVNHIPGFYMWLFLFVSFFIVLNLRNNRELEFKPTAARSLLTALLLVWSIVSFSGVSTFLYANF